MQHTKLIEQVREAESPIGLVIPGLLVLLPAVIFYSVLFRPLTWVQIEWY